MKSIKKSGWSGAWRVIADGLDLDDVIWTDECSVQLESHRKTTYHKLGEPSRMVSRPKHPPPKVHVWAGISAKGASSVVIFTGSLTATRYTDILEAALIPLVEEHYPLSRTASISAGQRSEAYQQVVTELFWREKHQ